MVRGLFLASAFASPLLGSLRWPKRPVAPSLTDHTTTGSLAASYLFIRLPDDLNETLTTAQLETRAFAAQLEAVARGQYASTAASARAGTQCLVNGAQQAAVVANVVYLVPLSKSKKKPVIGISPSCSHPCSPFPRSLIFHYFRLPEIAPSDTKVEDKPSSALTLAFPPTAFLFARFFFRSYQKARSGSVKAKGVKVQ